MPKLYKNISVKNLVDNFLFFTAILVIILSVLSLFVFIISPIECCTLKYKMKISIYIYFFIFVLFPCAFNKMIEIIIGIACIISFLFEFSIVYTFITCGFQCKSTIYSLWLIGLFHTILLFFMCSCIFGIFILMLYKLC